MKRQMFCSTVHTFDIVPENTVWNKVTKQFFILSRKLPLDLIMNPVHSTHTLFMCPLCSSRLEPVVCP